MSCSGCNSSWHVDAAVDGLKLQMKQYKTCASIIAYSYLVGGWFTAAIDRRLSEWREESTSNRSRCPPAV